MKYYVYTLSDPRCDEVFYVGKGKGSRLNAHEAEARKGKASRKCDVIREIESFGHTVRKQIVKRFEREQDAYDFEAEHIASFPEGQLTNLMPGGGGARGGHTLYDDRQQVLLATMMITRVRDRPKKFTLYGRTVDLTEMYDATVARLAEVTLRRGVDWANAIAAKHNAVIRVVVA